MASPNDQVDAELSNYDDESDMIRTGGLLQALFEKMMDEMSDEDYDAGCPAADLAHSPLIN